MLWDFHHPIVAERTLSSDLNRFGNRGAAFIDSGGVPFFSTIVFFIRNTAYKDRVYRPR